MRGSRFLAASLLLGLSAGGLSADETLIRNGPPEEKLDLVFLSDGYTGAELPLYRNDVDRFVDALFAQPPFSTHASLFNVHRRDIASVQSGAGNACLGTSVDTAFGSTYYDTGGDCRLLFTHNAAAVYAAASGAPGYDPGAGLVVVLVNSTVHGGAAFPGGYCVVSRGTHGPETMAHELGHSFGLLADEYALGGAPYAGGEPTELNVTIQTDRSEVKWNRWIDAATPLPTGASTPGLPGLYAGALGHETGVFRPTFESKMRSLGFPYDPVNEGLLVRRMDALLSPSVTILTPLAGSAPGEFVTIRVESEDGVGVAGMEVRVDGKPLGAPWTGSQPRVFAEWTWDASLAAPGPHAVSARAWDGAGGASEATVVVTRAGPPPPPPASTGGAGAPPPPSRPLVLSPGVRDGVNDAAVFGEDAVAVTIRDVSGRVVYSSSDHPSWDGRGAETGVYVALVRRRDGSESRRAVLIVR